MPPVRSRLLSRCTGYICASCRLSTGTLPSQRSALRIVTSQSRSASNVRSKLPREKKSASQQTVHGEDSQIHHYDEGENGELIPVKSVDDALEAKIGALEAELARLKSNISNPDRSSDDNTEDSILNEAKRNFLNKLTLDAVAKRPSAVAQNIAQGDLFISPEQFPIERRQYILRLNTHIERAAVGHQDAVSKDLWRLYSLCRKTLSSSWSQIPGNAWSVLWDTFSRVSLNNPDRMAHVVRLGEDMEAAGVSLSSSQHLLYLEAIFLQGDHELAITRWKTSRVALTFDESSEQEYWSLGVRMLAHDNRPTQAQEAADILLNGTKGEQDARVLIAVMAAWLASKDPAAMQKAWTMYIRFRVHMGNGMTMDDYDACIGVFLASNRADIALAVFRDMMLSRDPEALKSVDSVVVYKRVLQTVGDLRTLQLHPTETSWTSWEPFTFLPRKNQNKFFYGSWLKKLLGDGEVDWAAQVVDLMYERGVAPDSKHLNGIIGAWLRTNSARNMQKAEKMAWNMIQDRVDFVQRRARIRESTASEQSMLVRSVNTDAKNDYRRLQDSKGLALATIETFSILADNYHRRQKGERIKELCDILRVCAIPPNATFMNSLLRFGITSHRKAWSWALYLQLVREDNVVPNHETFVCLWKIMKVHVDPVKNRTTAGYPSSRTLFAEMLSWAPHTSHEVMSRELYDRILLCFGLADDQIGTGIALRAMQILYGIYPDQVTIRSIVLQLAKAGTVNAAGFAPRRLNLNSAQKDRIKQITGLLQRFREQRAKDLLAEGKDFDSLDEIAKSEQLILLLCDVLRFVVQSRTSPNQINAPGALPGGDTVSFQQLAEVAALQMGIPQNMRLPWTVAESIENSGDSRSL